MNSLQRRLQLWLTLSLVLLMGLLWLAGSMAVRVLGEDLISSRLEHDGENLLAAMEFTDAAQPQVRLKRLNPIYMQPFSGHYYTIRLADGSLQNSRSLWDQALEVPPLQPGGHSQWRVSGPADQRLLVWARHFQKQGHGFTLAVAEDLTPLEEHLSLFQWLFAGLAIGVLAILLLVQRQVIKNSFQRLDVVRADIERLGQGEAGSLSEDVPTEVLPLVQEFNRLLELLAQRLERSRNSLGNLAHALKGPLSLLVQYLDGKTQDDQSTRHTQAQDQVERIRQLMERELRRASLAGSGSPGQHFNAQNELPDLVGALQQIHTSREIDIQWQVVADIPSFGDREDMLELLGNLLDNACKWATSQVRCHISRGEGVTITVEDDGPGQSAEGLEKMAQRGIRLDETKEGHGLGLSIARDIVKLYNGDMQFKSSQGLGGLCVEIRLRLPGIQR